MWIFDVNYIDVNCKLNCGWRVDGIENIRRNMQYRYTIVEVQIWWKD